MGEVEVPPEAPAWMLALEKKQQRVHRLAHEVGAGSPCLLCQDDCPGLDLHFWRKICRNCKCKKEDHNVMDDCGAEQFEILLGSSHSHRPNKAFLEMLEKHTSAMLKNQLKSFAFDWVPPDVSPVIAAEYMQSLPASKLPVSGSDGALYRRQQLERQLPLHDLDASQCHQLTDTEVDNLKKYLENLKNNVVGQGRVSKLHIPVSNSLDSLSKTHSFNSVPKPFQSMAGNEPLLSGAQPQFEIGGCTNSGHAVHLKPPSAFWPKSISPEPMRSVSPGSDSQLPSLADRGAAFGVTLSPAKHARPLPKSKGASNELIEGPLNANHGRLYPGRIVTDQTLKSVSTSSNVPGNMWVPSECSECTRRGPDGRLIVERVCTHIVDSQNLPPLLYPSECTKCVQKIVDGKLVVGEVCPHISYSSNVSPQIQPSECSRCTKKIVDGKLVCDQVCPNVSYSSDLPHLNQTPECNKCIKKIVEGRFVHDQVCPHVSHSEDVPHVRLPTECNKCVQKIVDGQLVIGQVCPHMSYSSDVTHQVQPAECSKCIKIGHDGNYIKDTVCSHFLNPRDTIPSGLYPGPDVPFECSECPSAVITGQTVRDTICEHLSKKMNVPHGFNPEYLEVLKSQKIGSYDPELSPNENSKINPSENLLNYGTSISEGVSSSNEASPKTPGLLLPGTAAEKQECNTLPGLRVPSPLADNSGSTLRNKSPTSMMSLPGAPHIMALYAHNALINPASLDPQDTLSPHVGIMSLEDGNHSAPTEQHVPQTTDLTPVMDLKLHCAQCTEDISPGEVVVFADRAGSEVVWHPKCFVCNICQELLVDLVYFYNKGRVYCGRHYAEILDIPRCSACDELIFVKEYTVAEGQAFHVKHFCCFECDEPLGGKQYVPKDGQPICLPCYGRKYGKQCETCHLVIGAKDQGVTWKDLHWHATPVCFCCSFCQKSLLGGRFAVKDQKPFCCKECMLSGVTANHQKVSAV